MPRYFFDARDIEEITDDTGLELADLSAVRNEVARSLARTALDLLPAAGPSIEFSITVRDEAGDVVFSARLLYSSDPVF